MEQFPSFSILENILQNILSFHVWCHRNLSQFPVTPVTVWAERSFWPRTRDWCLIEMFTPAQAQWSFLEITSRDTGYTIPVAGAGYRGYHDIIEAPWISVTMTTLTRLSSERSTCVMEVFILGMVEKTRLLLGMRLGWPCWDGPSIFFCVSRICRSHKLA